MYSYQEKNYRVTSGGTILAPVSSPPAVVVEPENQVILDKREEPTFPVL